MIPLTLLTGFLGSGKTTVLNNLVRQPAMANALVVVNEFGAIGLDHLLVTHSREDDFVQMSSGCLCCTIRGDLVKTLRDITWRFAREGRRQFDRVVIETTGLADPAPILHTLMTDAFIAENYYLDGVVTAVDLAGGAQTLDRHPEAVKQAAVADLLLLTKQDLADPAVTEALIQRLAVINPAAPRLMAPHGRCDVEALLHLGLFDVASKSRDVQQWLKAEAYPDGHGHGHDHDHDHDHDHHHDVNRHGDGIRAFCFTIDEPVAADRFEHWLSLLISMSGDRMLRIKGLINVQGDPRPWVVHGVQHIFHPPLQLEVWPDQDRRTKLVFITRELPRELIEETFSFLAAASD